MPQRQIGAVVGHLLLKTGETTADLAATLGVSEKTVKRRLAGSQDWTADEVVGLAQHFRVPVALLFAGPDALFAGVLPEAGPEGPLHLKWLGDGRVPALVAA
jgi:DNA-binding XRE family transcriptional regulator